MTNFVYVFGTDSRDKLIAMQYELLKSDEAQHVYVFLNKECQTFACDGVRFALSDTLTF